MRRVVEGDVFVFIGNKTSMSHYDNFTVGEKYVVHSTSDMSAFGHHSLAVIFRDFTYGTYDDYIWINFELVEDQRDRLLSDIGI
jgi:hypothetical protein